MSIKIEGGDGTAENVIKAGTSNELLYNDKEVLLKEGLGLSLGLLPPDLKKAEEWEVAIKDYGSITHRPFTVPEDGWIVKVDFTDSYDSHFIRIDRGFGTSDGMTPGQRYIGNLVNYVGGSSKTAVIHNLNCPYPVKKGQVVEGEQDSGLITNNGCTTTVTFAPCMSV